MKRPSNRFVIMVLSAAVVAAVLLSVMNFFSATSAPLPDLADRDENVRLREVAELRKQRRDLHLESARVLVQDVSNWCSQITVNKGSAHGVEEGDPAASGTGARLGVGGAREGGGRGRRRRRGPGGIQPDCQQAIHHPSPIQGRDGQQVKRPYGQAHHRSKFPVKTERQQTKQQVCPRTGQRHQTVLSVPQRDIVIHAQKTEKVLANPIELW